MRLKPKFNAFKSKIIKPCSKIFSSIIHNFDRRSFSLKPSRFRRRHRRFRTKVVRFRKPFSLRSLRLPRYRPKTSGLRPLKRRIGKTRFRLRKRPRHSRRAPAPEGDRFGEKIAGIMTVFKSTKRSRELEQVMDLHSGSENGTGNGTASSGGRPEPFPSPNTPAFARVTSTNASSTKKETMSDGDGDGDEDEDEGAFRSFESYLAEMIVEDGKVKDLKDVEELLYCWRSLKSPVFVDLVSRFYGEVCKDLFEEEETTTSD